MNLFAPTGETSARDAGAADCRLSVIILTGALGSGKTTLLNALLKSGELSGAAVLVNEFGDIGVDHEIVREVHEDVVLLASGCLCCQVSGDLRESLLDLTQDTMRAAAGFSGPVIVETSGLANPIPILQLLRSDSDVRRFFLPGPVVTTVDAVSTGRGATTTNDTCDQIALADMLYITKTDLASAADQQAVAALLDEINPDAARFDAGDPHALAQRIADAGPMETSPFHCLPSMDAAAHTDGIGSVIVEAEGTVSRSDLEIWLQLLVQAQGENILRIKGVAAVEDGPVLVQGVGPLFHPLWPASGEPGVTRLVVIGRRLDGDAIGRSFRETCRGEECAARTAGKTGDDTGVPAPPDIAEACLHVVEQAMGTNVSPALLWNVHNPWSVAGSMLPAWDFLGICEDPAVVDLVRPMIGNDILLVETDIAPSDNAPSATGSELPLEPCAGAELRLHVDMAHRTVTATIHSFDDPPAASRSGVAVLAIRYAPATARFIRDPEHPANRARLSTRPLANPASGPVFLVSGENRAENNLARGFDRPRAEWL